MPQIIPTAEPFFFPGSRTGCLLIHGFTGAPKEMRQLGEYLREKGYTVLGIRLAGHATRPEDMIASSWTDWTASVEDGYHLLHGAVDRVYLIGLSMGGALSLLMSARLDVKGVVAISSPYQLAADWRMNFTEWIGKFQPYLPKSKGAPSEGWFDIDAWRQHVSYSENPIRSIGQLHDLLAELRLALSQVHVPVLLIHSQDDRYVPPQNMELTFAALVNSPDKTKQYITGSGHVATEDASRQQVFEMVNEFIGRLEKTETKIDGASPGGSGEPGSQ
jgi:carboxylesterase